MTRDTRDIYQRFEIEVRTSKKRSLLDAFLPAPETLESSVAPDVPAPLPLPDEMTAEEANMFRRREPEPEEEPAPQPKLKSKKKAARKKEEPRSLQDEVAEFMKRDRALAPDDDLSSLVDKALDPKPDPDKKD